MTKYILSTIAWVESIAKKEVEKQGWKILKVRDRMIEFEWDSKTMIRVNLWSRVWNKVYQVLEEWNNIDNFDKLYDLVWKIDFKKYFHHNYPIVVKVKSINSKLDSTPAIQKITKKAIIDKITDKSWEKIFEDRDLEKFEIMVLLIDDKVKILLNNTWEALHKRGYRIKTWDAPIKESLAAALVLLSWWRFKETFYDVFCGSGTIAIEAAMIAKNIAPGLDRYFAFENLVLVDKKLVWEELKLAKSKIFNWNYKIIASDIDKEVLEIAKQNAKEAWVDDIIEFNQKDFTEYLKQDLKWALVSNPPYWERLKVEFLDELYENIDKLFKQNKDLNWWIITSYFDWFDKIIKKDFYKKRKLYNWGEKCYFYKKK
jgi:putative N6-adenine-specific DNA methylase